MQTGIGNVSGALVGETSWKIKEEGFVSGRDIFVKDEAVLYFTFRGLMRLRVQTVPCFKRNSIRFNRLDKSIRFISVGCVRHSKQQNNVTVPDVIVSKQVKPQ